MNRNGSIDEANLYICIAIFVGLAIVGDIVCSKPAPAPPMSIYDPNSGLTSEEIEMLEKEMNDEELHEEIERGRIDAQRDAPIGRTYGGDTY